MEYGTPHQKDGNAFPPVGSRIPSGITWRCMQVKRMLEEISNLGQLIQNNTKSDPTNHDPGDEDPNAWINQ